LLFSPPTDAPHVLPRRTLAQGRPHLDHSRRRLRSQADPHAHHGDGDFGHEFWSADGKTIWYDLQTPRGEDFWLAGYNIDSGARTWYHLQRNECPSTSTSRATAFCFAATGRPWQVAKAPDGEWLYLFRPEMIEKLGLDDKGFVQPGVLRAERLVNMSKHGYRLEPNVSFTPDRKWVVFRSTCSGRSTSSLSRWQGLNSQVSRALSGNG